MPEDYSSPSCRTHEAIVEIPLRFFLELNQLSTQLLQARLRYAENKNPGICISAWYYMELLNAAVIMARQYKDAVIEVPPRGNETSLEPEFGEED
jgi:hypothetical protein